MIEDTQEAQDNFDDKLVRLWIQARDEHLGIAWIAGQLRVSPKYVNNRAKYLKRKGVKVPSLQGRKGIIPVRIEKLNRIIKESGKNGV